MTGNKIAFTLLFSFVSPSLCSWAVIETAGEVTSDNWKFGEGGSLSGDTMIPDADKGTSFSHKVRGATHLTPITRNHSDATYSRSLATCFVRLLTGCSRDSTLLFLCSRAVFISGCGVRYCAAIFFTLYYMSSHEKGPPPCRRYGSSCDANLLAPIFGPSIHPSIRPSASPLQGLAIRQ